MSAERWRRIEDLYRAVSASDVHERAELLARADPDVRREVESLLAHRSDAGPLDGFAVDLIEQSDAPLHDDALTLPPGTALGPYTILERLGAGGMGIVYHAQDTRLGRDVAIKVLSSRANGDGDRRQRFEREARAIAALSHPHICTLHDIGHERVRVPEGEATIDFLVMERVEGETLAERLKRGPLSPERALEYSIQIADALDRAHRRGIVHRDLKPANVMVTNAGVKLLDFGLASLAASTNALRGGAKAQESTHGLSTEGTILGTLQYMAPEQLEGREADARADIFAFGAVLYEMATGRKAFEAPDRAGLITAILEAEPKAILDLQPLSSPALDRLVRECLAKNPDDRWQNARDVLKHLKWITSLGSQLGATASPAAHGGRSRLVVIVAAILLVGLALGLLLARQFLPAAGERAHVRFEVSIPPIQFLPNLSISPDGRRIVFGARTPGGHIALFVRSLDSPQPRHLPGTEGVRGLFWSPDSRHIGFVANGKLKRIDLSGGPPLDVCDSPDFLGGTWNADGVIVFGRTDGPLMRVSASRGEPVPVTQLDESRGEFAHGWPVFLPDGRRFLYLAVGMELRNRAIYAGSLDSPARTEVLRASARPLYAAGHLLFHRDTTLLAQPFDVERLRLTGKPTRIADGVIFHVPSGFAAYDVSHTGTLVYRRQPTAEESTLTWFDRTGQRLETVGAPGVYRGVALSPDNRRIALHLHEVPDGGDIWVVDRDRAAFSKLTFRGHNWRPVWSPDGRFIAFSSTRAGDFGSLYRQASSGAGDAEILLKKEAMAKLYADDWASDGQSILYSETTRDSTGPDIGVLRLNERERTPKLLVSEELDQGLSKFSPDGRWIAYESSESGRREIYVRPYAEGGGQWQISTDGGRYVRWARNGRELFYLKDDGSLMVADVLVQEAAFRSGTPRLLFKANPVLSNHSSDTQLDIPYDVTRDGQRFLFTERLTSAGGQTSLTIVLNWTAALEQ